jgi:DNA-binding transcriptional ArsR family regulator
MTPLDANPAQDPAAPVTPPDALPWSPSDQVFHDAAKTFRVMAAPLRLKIISALCQGEKNVGELLQSIDTTQPNMSQHLHTLHRAGILGRRRDGVQIYYRIVNESVVGMCRAMCVQLAIESDDV